MVISAGFFQNSRSLSLGLFRGRGCMSKSVQEFKVVFVSPKDMALQRQVGKKVVARLNKTLTAMNKPYRLKAMDQRDVRPEAGKASEVASKNLQIENCHILIGIFGREFGSRPGKRRQSDGYEYQSGTEQEIDEAFIARQRNRDTRPSIMLYRREDISPAGMTEDEIVEYARVIDYIKGCREGEHEAFIGTYKATPGPNEKSFEEMLEEHILVTCQEHEELWRKEQDDPPGSKRTNLAEEWLAKVRLKGNPFSINLPERIFQEEFTVQFPELSTQQKFHLLYQAQDPIYIFGSKGCGKTTLLENILAESQSYINANPRVKICFARLGASQFDLELERMDEWQNNLKPVHMVHLICRSVENILRNSLSRTLPELGITDYSQPKDALNKLMEWLQKADQYTDLVCLVDELDEVNKIKNASPKHPSILKILKAMLLIPKVEGIKMRYFLPAYLEEKMQGVDRDLYRTDKFTCIHLIWDAGRMKEMISQRMVASSITRGSYDSIDRLYQRDGTEQETIDDRLARLADGNPRVLIRMCDRLFEHHFEQRPIPDRIQPASLRTVEQEVARQRNSSLESGDEMRGFEIRNGCPYFNNEKIELSNIPERLLVRLIQANGETCSRETLIQAGWPDVKNYRGVSEKTFYAQIAILKKALNQYTPGWTRSDRGKGYSLKVPKKTNGASTGGRDEN